MASRHCDACNGWHDLEADWPRECMGHYRRKGEDRSGLTIIKDIEPYKNVIDGGVIGSRKEHKDFLRSRGLVEIGNEQVTHRPEEAPGLKQDIRRALEEHGGLRRRG